MLAVRLFLVFSVVFVSTMTNAFAQSGAVVVPLGDELITIPVEGEPSPYLEDAIKKERKDRRKKIIWNKGWDNVIGHKTIMDPTVKISLTRLEPVFGYPGIIFTANEISHWGEQTVFPASKTIYAKGVLMVDKGNTIEGGPFEWSLNRQGFMSFHNILRKDYPAPWIAAWKDPKPGDRVWFFIMSDDERFSSNPISFIWP